MSIGLLLKVFAGLFQRNQNTAALVLRTPEIGVSGIVFVAGISACFVNELFTLDRGDVAVKHTCNSLLVGMTVRIEVGVSCAVVVVNNFNGSFGVRKTETGRRISEKRGFPAGHTVVVSGQITSGEKNIDAQSAAVVSVVGDLSRRTHKA